MSKTTLLGKPILVFQEGIFGVVRETNDCDASLRTVQCYNGNGKQIGSFGDRAHLRSNAYMTEVLVVDCGLYIEKLCNWRCRKINFDITWAKDVTVGIKYLNLNSIVKININATSYMENINYNNKNILEDSEIINNKGNNHKIVKEEMNINESIKVNDINNKTNNSISSSLIKESNIKGFQPSLPFNLSTNFQTLFISY
ncbi:hypothetical protein U3516DRAFT_748143 [Neocallimastix sp. 'constans']